MRPKVINRTNSNNEQVFYYMCEMKEKSKRTRCNCKNLLGNEADHLMLHRLKGVFDSYSPAFNNIPLSNKLFFSFLNTKIKAESIPSKLRDIEASLTRLTNVLSKNIDLVVEEAILLQMGRLSKEKRQLEEKLELYTANKADKEAGGHSEAAGADKEVADSEGKIKEDISYSNDINGTSYKIRLINNMWWNLMDNKYKKMMIKSMVKQVVWYEDKIVVELHGS